jgi:hypothetical protein
MTILVNGRKMSAATLDDRYHAITRRWTDGDRIDLRCTAALRVCPADMHPFSESAADVQIDCIHRHAALLYGPYVLGVDRFLNPDVDLRDLIISLPTSAVGEIKLKSQRCAKQRGPFATASPCFIATGSFKQGRLPTGWSDHERFDVKLRPLCELTGCKLEDNGLYVGRFDVFLWDKRRAEAGKQTYH